MPGHSTPIYDGFYYKITGIYLYISISNYNCLTNIAFYVKYIQNMYGFFYFVSA
ncbi:hypothetical protein SAMN04487843_104159 [Methylobacterium sp. ap11]|nr:hypothetical protein SAMN04487843_104159 [Methylobacterium sp. ap11]